MKVAPICRLSCLFPQSVKAMARQFLGCAIMQNRISKSFGEDGAEAGGTVAGLGVSEYGERNIGANPRCALLIPRNRLHRLRLRKVRPKSHISRWRTSLTFLLTLSSSPTPKG